MSGAPRLAACTPQDAAALCSIGEQTMREAFAAQNTREDMDAFVAEAFNLAAIQAQLQNPASRFYFLQLEGETAGYLHLNFAPAQTEMQDETSLEIQRIYVLQKHQGKGLGAFMVHYAVSLAKAEGLCYIWLGVWEHNTAAQAFYKRMGFVRFGQHSFQFGSDAQTDWLLRLEV